MKCVSTVETTVSASTHLLERSAKKRKRSTTEYAPVEKKYSQPGDGRTEPRQQTRRYRTVEKTRAKVPGPRVPTRVGGTDTREEEGGDKRERDDC